jgi:hypothetical protein
MSPPIITIEVRNQSRHLINPGLIPATAGITLINITSIAYDAFSGLMENKIEYTVTGETFEQKILDCGPGPSPGYSRCSTADPWSVPPRTDIPFDETKSVRYRVIAEDRAGNANVTKYYFTVSHPLANFGTRSVFLALGESRLIPVMVRNLQNQQDDIILNISGTDTFSRFEFSCDPDRCVISPDGRSMTVLNMNTFEERIYYVRLLSSQPAEYYLELDARSSVDIGLTDFHHLNMTTSYPIYFPGIEPWAMIVLLILAGLSFGLVASRIDL